jgi:peroxiredoxin
MKWLSWIAALLAVRIAMGADAPPAKFGALAAGTVAPDFVVNAADGKSVKLSEFRGKTVVLSFWTTNRGPATALDAISSEYAGAGVVIVGVCSGATREEFSQAVQKSKGSISYLLAWDPAGKSGDRSAAKLFGIGAFPSTGVIDPAGKIVGGFTGFGAQSATVLREYLRTAGVPVAADGVPDTGPVGGAEPPRELKPGDVATNFTAVDPAGRPAKLSDFTGKIVVLNFWATWCEPCLAAMPLMQQIAAATKPQGVAVLAACTSDSRADFEIWTKANAGKYPDIVFANDPVGRDSPATYADRVSVKLYGVRALPTVLVIARDGKVAEVFTGYGEGDDRLETFLKKLGVSF